MVKRKVHPIVDDMLTRISRTGLSDQQVHAQADLPNGWLSQARAGRYSPTADNVKKALRWLVRFEQGRAAAPAPAVVAPAASAPIGTGAPPPAKSVGPELASAIRSAHSYDSLGALIERIMIGAALPEGDPEHLDEGLASVLVVAARERRMLVKGAEHEKAMQALTTRARHLTQEEANLITSMRAAKTPLPLAPDQAVPPPAGAVAT